MSPETLIIDRRFKGVGRLKLACGSTRQAVKRKIERMLAALADENRIDLLRALRDRQITLAELHYAYQRNTLDALPIGETAAPLIPAMRAWIKTEAARGVEKTAEARETSVRYLERLKADAAISEIPELLMELRRTLGKTHARSFNIARSAASAFVRQAFMRNHPLYQRTIAVELLPEKAVRKHHPLTVEEMHEYFPAPATDPVDAIAWGMALTGMGAKEYWGKWRVRADRVRIEGTKTEFRARDVPLLQAPAVPTMHRRTFEDKLRDRTHRAITTYDLRRTYSNWMEAAGILRTRRKLYMGHSVGDVLDRYERHEVTAFLLADGQKLAAFVGLPQTPTLHLSARNTR